MKTTESNKLIAEFMGTLLNEMPESNRTMFTVVSTINPHRKIGEVINVQHFHSGFFAYNNSWDLLMPVVEKIAADYHETRIVSDEESDYCRIKVYDKNGVLDHEIFECGLDTKEATYKAVVSFIQWHNEQANYDPNDLGSIDADYDNQNSN